MREEKIGAFIITEAHMDDERKENIDSLFGRVMRMEFTKDEHTANAKGVAIVINKRMMKNVDGEDLSILGVYAPNAPGENTTFWKTIQTWYEVHDRVRKPDVMGGDFNMVEDAIDRNPSRLDNNGPMEAMDELKTYLGLIDGWRETFPTTCAYTYHQ
ncbi:hypothetical protein C8R47DRAFT_922979, partial [Mycena vitilis]